MSIQGSTFITTNPQSNKPFSNFTYQRSAALDWPYRIFFNLRKTTNCLPSLLKSLVSPTNTGYQLGISAWSNSFVSQYFDSTNLGYTEKSTSTSLWLTGPLENMSSGFQGTVCFGHPLSWNIGPWTYFLYNHVSSCTWKTMLLKAHCDHQLIFLKQSTICPLS